MHICVLVWGRYMLTSTAMGIEIFGAGETGSCVSFIIGTGNPTWAF